MTTSEHTSSFFPKKRREWSQRLVSSNGVRPQLRRGRAAWGHIVRHHRGLALALCILLSLLGKHDLLAAPAAKKRSSAKDARGAPVSRARRSSRSQPVATGHSPSR